MSDADVKETEEVLGNPIVQPTPENTSSGFNVNSMWGWAQDFASKAQEQAKELAAKAQEQAKVLAEKASEQAKELSIKAQETAADLAKRAQETAAEIQQTYDIEGTANIFMGGMGLSQSLSEQV